MQLLKLFSLLLCAIGLFTACEKDKDDTNKPTIAGFWKGKYGGINNYPTLAYGQLFRADGTVRVYDGNDTATAAKGEGTYVVSNGTVNTTYSYGTSNKYSTAASIDAAMTLQEGTYGTGTNATNGGRYFIVKQ